MTSLRRKSELGKRSYPEDVENIENNNNNVSASKNIKLELARSSKQTIKNEVDQKCGKILRIHLLNFMCHANLTIDLHKRVNFLVGSNGSGKSSILAAIVIGLGGTPKSSGRSKLLRDLIQNGKNSAKIEIDIYNGGADAYEPERYGDVITVVRNIYQTSTGYLIKNRTGHVVSKKLDDLKRILLYHNLQPENPVFVMNQESSRNFLKSMQPIKNYQLFLKATQIELIIEKLTDCRQYRKDQVFSLECLEKQVEEKEHEIRKLQKQLQKVQSLENLKRELALKEVELDWAKVSAKSKEVAEGARALANLEKEREQVQSSLHNRDQQRLQLKEEINELKASVAEHESAYKKATREVSQTLKQQNSKSADINALKRETQDCQKQLRQLENQVEEFRRVIKEKEKENPMDLEEKRKADEQEKMELQCELNDLKKEKQKLMAEFHELTQSLNEKEEEYNESKSQQQAGFIKIEKIRANMRQTSANQKNKLFVYGSHVQQLLEDIKAEYKKGNFKEMPRGPIGSFLSVKDMTYCDTIENYLGGLLSAFIVSCTADCTVLKKLISKYPNYQPPIITTYFAKQVYDTSALGVVPPEGTRLLLNELKCSDPVVMNTLIDQKRIESVLLTKNKSTAEQYTSQHENVPRHLSRILTQNPPMEIFPDPMYRMYSLKVRPARFLQQNIKEIIRTMENNIQQEQALLEESGQYVLRAQNEMDEINKLIRQKRKELSSNQNKYTDLEGKIQELNNIEYPSFNQLDILRKEFQKDVKKLEPAQQIFAEKKEQLNVLNEELNAIEEKLQEYQNVARSCESQMQTINAKINNLNKNLTQLDDNFLKKGAKIKEMDETIHKLRIELESTQSELERLTEKAQIKGPKMEDVGTIAEVQDTIKKLSLNIKKYTVLGIEANIPELQEILKAKEHTLQTDRNNYETLKISIELLEQSLRERFNFLKKLRAHMSLLLKFTFTQILKARNFHGAIELDFKEQTLDLTVVPRLLDGQECVSSTRALSGGERSYCTVAFLLSLWGCVDHPFFFLDEYDVFTDEVNREYMTRLLIAEGSKRPNRQFIFLTPLDMTVASTDFIKIHRLAPPKR